MSAQNYTPRQRLIFLVLGAFFLSNAILAELIGGKLIFVAPENFTLWGMGPFAASVGVFLWPVVFVTTDLVNEYLGKRGVQFLSMLTAAMIIYVFMVIAVMRWPQSTDFSGINDAEFDAVFGQGQWIIVGSIIAFLVAQLIDVTVFQYLRARTGNSMLWLRATGSTVVSQLIDSIIVLYIGLAIPLEFSFSQFMSVALPNYFIKLLIAVAMTPMIYIAHAGVEWYVGKEDAQAMAEKAAQST